MTSRYLLARPSFDPVLSVLVLVVALLVTGCGSFGPGDGGPLVTRPPEATPTGGPPATGEPTTAPSPGPTAEPADTIVVKVHFFAGDGALVAVARTIPRTQAVARAALGLLLDGPPAAWPDLSTAVPAGTLLLGVSIADQIATVDLSREFESGGGSASMFGRLAQVVFTLTQFPTVDGVLFRLDGHPVTVFSGEGIVLDGPSTRADYTAFLPPIFVDTPGRGGVLGNPARLVGLANTFEASFIVEIRDVAGRVLAGGPAMATCGTGCWGTFDLTIPYAVAAEGPGSVVVYELSAKDGSVVNLRETPVTLTP
ncbi:MAG TPA: GerMN domain-containing protein [Patescibacteria group bacterium]|nr:GerMN domain-containing protein [Patescibacteria group bacterium]